MSESINSAAACHSEKKEGDLCLIIPEANVKSSVHNQVEKTKEFKLYSVYGTIFFKNGEIPKKKKKSFLDKFNYHDGKKIEDFQFYELSNDAISKIDLSIFNEFDRWAKISSEKFMENIRSHLNQISKINLREQKIIKFEEIRPESVIVFEFKHLVVKRENRIEIRHETSIEELKRDALADSLYYNRRAIKRNLNGQFLCMMYITKKLKISQRLTRY